jgi:hypothetical protein
MVRSVSRTVRRTCSTTNAPESTGHRNRTSIRPRSFVRKGLGPGARRGFGCCPLWITFVWKTSSTPPVSLAIRRFDTVRTTAKIQKGGREVEGHIFHRPSPPPRKVEINRNKHMNYDNDEALAYVYLTTMGGHSGRPAVRVLYVMTTHDAKALCSSSETRGKARGSEWMLCWTNKARYDGMFDPKNVKWQEDDGRFDVLMRTLGISKQVHQHL